MVVFLIINFIRVGSRMIRYIALDEMSTDKLQKEVIKLYKVYVEKYNTLNEVVKRISKKLNVAEGMILQILQASGEINV